MSEVLTAALAAMVAVLTIAAIVRRRRGVAKILVAADPEAALIFSAAALRRLGARITRYDSEAGTLEARVSSGAGVVRVRAAADGEHVTLVHLEGDAAARRVVRRFRGALSA